MPLTPGWNRSTVCLHFNVSAGGGVAASRAIHFENRTANLNVRLGAELKAKANVVLAGSTYVAADLVFGGQFALAVLGV